MPSTPRVALVALIVGVATALAVVATHAGRDSSASRPRGPTSPAGSPKGGAARAPAYRPPPVPLFSDGFVDDSGYTLALYHTPPIGDRGSLEQVRAAYRGKAERTIADLQAEWGRLPANPSGDARIAAERARVAMLLGLIRLYDGEFAASVPWFERARDEPGLGREMRVNLGALLGVAALRRGEVENCVDCLGPSSCIIPIDRSAVHQFPSGSREAVRRFTAYLKERPEDLGVRWLLNVAAMTLGEYPEKVPPEYLIPPEVFRSKREIGRFVNVAPTVGLGSRGANMLGGSVFDDFDGDGLPDVFVCSGDTDLGAALFLNRGDGTFEERDDSGLESQTLAVNAAHADFDNDGRLDVLLLRGGWEEPAPLSLLRNLGGGRFEDVTRRAGLAEPIASQSAAWGDFDNDGDLDLFVCGEYRAPEFDDRNRCRLYRNEGDGTFRDIAAEAGVENQGWAKGVAWGDYDDDGRPDLYVSNAGGPNRLFHNEGDGTFSDVARQLGVDEPIDGFACWFWDFDNDGRLDLFAAGFNATPQGVVADLLGQTAKGERTRLYRNLGEAGFRDVSAEARLDRVLLPMGANFGDIDNDGYLDIYLATGRPQYSALVPNVLLRNDGGRRFEDVTYASGTGHLQKGHGVSFADYDRDGDLDLLVEVGGQTPGDRANNLLFRNPGHGRHWLQVKLVGTKSNRSALGAKVRVDLTDPDGSTRSIHRVVSGGSSFGGNSLAAWLGLGDSERVATLTVTWPTSKTTQTFRDLDADRRVEVVEGADTIREPAGAPPDAPRAR